MAQYMLTFDKLQIDKCISNRNKLPSYKYTQKYHEYNVYKHHDSKKILIIQNWYISQRNFQGSMQQIELNVSEIYDYNIEQFKLLFKAYSKLYNIKEKKNKNNIYHKDDKCPIIFGCYYSYNYLIKVVFPRNYKHYPIIPGFLVNPNNQKMILYDYFYLQAIHDYNKLLEFIEYLEESKVYPMICEDIIKLIYEYAYVYERRTMAICKITNIS